MSTPPAASFSGEEAHPRDIPEEELQRALAETSRPDLLQELAATARETFGFFPRHYPYTLHYPWVLERLESLPEQSRVVDVGAGVTPLPLALARRNVHVDCIDNSELERTIPATADWNEWGFFDYATIDSRIHSYHCDARTYSPTQPYDAAYSVCVLAHLQRFEREEVMARFPAWLRPGGRLLLVIDLVPETDSLWNRSDGVEVAPGREHGTTADLFKSICEAGLNIKEWTIRRAVHAALTDLLFVDAVTAA